MDVLSYFISKNNNATLTHGSSQFSEVFPFFRLCLIPSRLSVFTNQFLGRFSKQLHQHQEINYCIEEKNEAEWCNKSSVKQFISQPTSIAKIKMFN